MYCGQKISGYHPHEKQVKLIEQETQLKKNDFSGSYEKKLVTSNTTLKIKMNTVVIKLLSVK